MSVPLRAVQLNEVNAILRKHPEVLYVDLLIEDMNGVVACKESELAEFENSISDLEYNEYLHTV